MVSLSFCAPISKKMFGRKACNCTGRLGGKVHHQEKTGGKVARSGSPAKVRNITVDKAVGAGDMGPGAKPLLGNTHNGLSNGQRDIIDHGNAQTAMTKRKTGGNPIESKKKNKAQ